VTKRSLGSYLHHATSAVRLDGYTFSCNVVKEDKLKSHFAPKFNAVQVRYCTAVVGNTIEVGLR
jgi:hypothetical protein